MLARMSVLYIALPVALLIVGVAVALFIWATRSGQYDDLETPPRRMLLDDEPARSEAPGRDRPGRAAS
jgi:cbb3-type cytochrome oxidase maturation protein